LPVDPKPYGKKTDFFDIRRNHCLFVLEVEISNETIISQK
jgi:hypothetical protein